MSKGKQTKQRIVDASLKVADRVGYLQTTRDLVATEADCATGLIYRYFPTMDSLRDHLVHKAIERRALRVVGEALAARHPVALALPLHFRQQAAPSFANA